MPDRRIKRALISVYDKTGIVDFARALASEFGIEIISTGGTAKLLKENNIPVTLVEDITGWGEMLDGRVKTLHPKIHAAILADRENPKHMQQLADAGIEPIDMVVVNLYPFEKTVADPNCKFEDAIEMIDIGGPCLLRAAAKNHRHVVVVSSAATFGDVLDDLRTHGDATKLSRRILATRVFDCCMVYNQAIEIYLTGHCIDAADESSKRVAPESDEGSPADSGPFARMSERLDQLSVDLYRGVQRTLRYGENPTQQACVIDYAVDGATGDAASPGSASMSYNNSVDADAAIQLCSELARAAFGKHYACVFIKHTNACGVGMAGDPVEAYCRAYLGDPNAAMGGILACSFPVTTIFAQAVMNSLDRWGRDAGAGAFFTEVWAAPRFPDDACKAIRSAKQWGERVRLLSTGDMTIVPYPDVPEMRSVASGVLMQTPDTVGLNEDQWKVVTARQPSEQELSDLRLAWLIAKHTKSNAISICKDGMLIGNGAGQMSRVMSCRIAAWLANENGHAGKLAGSAAASDAFFPFRDGPDLLIDAGVTAIIQPGGSKRDADTIAACNERGVAMIFTGTRHFRH